MLLWYFLERLLYSWDSNVQKVINNGKKKLKQLPSFLSKKKQLQGGFIVSFGTSSYFSIMVVKYGLIIEILRIYSARKIIGCSTEMCNKAVRRDIESLKGRRDVCKLKWWYKVNN